MGIIVNTINELTKDFSNQLRINALLEYTIETIED